MRKAAAPITGGTSCPPVEFMASMAPATAGRKPVDFIRGTLMTPSTITLAADEPEAVPNKALVRMETLAGPPRRCPATLSPRFTMNFPMPEASSTAPNRMNRYT